MQLLQHTSNRTSIWNNDGSGEFSKGQSLDGEGMLADLDNDGDLDMVASNGSPMVLYENDGEGNFQAKGEVYDGLYVSSFDVGDVNGDGKIDVVVAIVGGGRAFRAVWSNEGNFDFTPVSSLRNDRGEFVLVDLFDADVDGDIDALLGKPWGDTDTYEVLLNDGDGTFSRRSSLGEADFPNPPGWLGRFPLGIARATFADVNGDGAKDVFVGGRLLLNNALFGDVNGDQRFDQLDIVQVLQGAKYLSGKPATFEEGDWNRDGVFDQRDIIAAFSSWQLPHLTLRKYGVDRLSFGGHHREFIVRISSTRLGKRG